jgi:hypothetical protein
MRHHAVAGDVFPKRLQCGRGQPAGAIARYLRQVNSVAGFAVDARYYWIRPFTRSSELAGINPAAAKDVPLTVRCSIADKPELESI